MRERWQSNDIKHLTRGAVVGTLIEGGRVAMQDGEFNTEVILTLAALDLAQYVVRKVLAITQSG